MKVPHGVVLMKKVLMITAALAAILAMSLAAVAVGNYVRWNNQLDECVYYYTSNGNRASCYVNESNCASRDPWTNEAKDVDPVGCYSVPRKLQVQQAGACPTFTEGQKVTLRYQGSDPDQGVGPAGKLVYTFESPFDGNGTWQTGRGDAGNYTTKVTVSDGQYSATATVCFTVLPGNHPPTLTVHDVTAQEGDAVRLSPVCTDPDGDAVRLTVSGDLDKATWQTGYADAGTYRATITCTDTSGATASKEVTVTVQDVNRPPVLTNIGDVTVEETGTVTLAPRCVDPEGGNTTVTYTGDMTSDSWTTGYDDAGVYNVTVTCADSTGLETSKDITVTVLDKNRPPTITAMAVAG